MGGNGGHQSEGGGGGDGGVVVVVVVAVVVWQRSEFRAGSGGGGSDDSGSDDSSSDAPAEYPVEKTELRRLALRQPPPPAARMPATHALDRPAVSVCCQPGRDSQQAALRRLRSTLKN